MKKRSSWKILKKENAFQTPWLGIDKYRVRVPSGKEKDLYMTVAKDAVMIFAVTKDERVVVNWQHHFYFKKKMPELPAGFIEAGNAIETAKAELLEETGCTAREFIPIGSVNIERWRVGKMHCVVALDAEHIADQMLEDSEDIDVAFIEMSEFREMLKNNVIENGPSVACGYMALDYLNKI
jgi:ADP-ribose pyrophosphatase